jgi:photosystem II stability/assembly factor-like uncharacterized protein
MKKRILLLTGLAFVLLLAFVFKNKFNAMASPEKARKGPADKFEFFDILKGKAPDGLYTSWYRSTIGNKNGPQLLDSMVEIGPVNIGGRTRAVLWNRTNADHLLVGAISGGLWNSNSRGRSWNVVNDYEVNLNITCITHNPFNADVIYYGTGEGAGNSSGAPGAGIFKSTDGGKTFKQLPATIDGTFDYCWSIKHSKVEDSTIYVSTNSRGLWRSKNGGMSFERVYNTSRPIHDIEILADSTILFGVQGLGVFHSKTGDVNSFVGFTTGLPAGSAVGRIEIAYCETAQENIYLGFANASNNGFVGVYRTKDAGQTWTAANTSLASAGLSFPFTWYTLVMQVKYDNPEMVAIGSVNIGYSLNGGKNWTQASNSHADYHVMEIHPDMPDKLMVGNDGGMFEYDWNSMGKFINLNRGLHITQYYTGTYAPVGITVMGGTQDNGTSLGLNGSDSFTFVYGADGSHCHIHQQNNKTAYISWQNGRLRKTLDYTKKNPVTFDIVNDMDLNGNGEVDDGVWFIHPYEMNHLNSEHLIFPAKRRIYQSLDGGNLWEPITNTVNQGTAQEAFSVAMTNQLNPTVYVGGSNGLFYRINNSLTAKPGEEVNLRGTAPNAVRTSFIGSIKAHPTKHNVLYLGLTNYATTPRIYRVDQADSDTAISWVDISGNLPASLPVNWIEVDPNSPDSVIFAATDFGLYYTADAGQTWHKDPIIPNVAVDMLRLRHSDRRLFIYTHGRGIFTARVIPKKNGNPIDNFVSGEFLANGIKIYPNPASDFIQVDFASISGIEATLFDLNGRRLKQEKLSGNLRWDLKGIPSGTYFLSLQSGTERAVKKIIIKH